MIPVRQYNAAAKRLQRLGAPLPPGFWGIPPHVGASHCNWIGSDDPSVKWISAPLNTFFPWMKPATIGHDLWWSLIYNDGSRTLFVRSNDEFLETLDLLAEDSFGWAWPRQFRNTLRDARHWQADRAHDILMSDTCWDIWQKNANIEEGPEVLG